MQEVTLNLVSFLFKKKRRKHQLIQSKSQREKTHRKDMKHADSDAWFSFEVDSKKSVQDQSPWITMPCMFLSQSRQKHRRRKKLPVKQRHNEISHERRRRSQNQRHDEGSWSWIYGNDCKDCERTTGSPGKRENLQDKSPSSSDRDFCQGGWRRRRLFCRPWTILTQPFLVTLLQSSIEARMHSEEKKKKENTRNKSHEREMLGQMSWWEFSDVIISRKLWFSHYCSQNLNSFLLCKPYLSKILYLLLLELLFFDWEKEKVTVKGVWKHRNEYEM